MLKHELTLPQIAAIGGTRGALGAGIALLVAHKLSAAQRRDVGWTLAAIGALSTIPLALMIFRSRKAPADRTPRIAPPADI
jgi:hypothetical protein